MKKILAIGFVVCFALIACKSKKEVTKDTKIEERAVEKLTEEVADNTYDQNQMPNDSEGDILEKRALAKLSDSLVARIQRTACFGRCPIYTASIYKSGYVSYMGEKWVEREGHYEAQISQNKIAELLNEAKKIGFQDLNNVYDSKGITDLPSTIITLRLENEPKIVVNRYQGPESLGKFGVFFDNMINELSFQKVVLD